MTLILGKVSTPQGIFNRVVTMLRRQGKPSIKEEICQYNDGRGNKCAVGWCLTNKDYTEEMEGRAVCVIKELQLLPERFFPHVELLKRLQIAHDNSNSRDNGNRAWLKYQEEQWASIATEFNLKLPKKEGDIRDESN